MFRVVHLQAHGAFLLLNIQIHMSAHGLFFLCIQRDFLRAQSLHAVSAAQVRHIVDGNGVFRFQVLLGGIIRDAVDKALDLLPVDLLQKPGPVGIPAQIRRQRQRLKDQADGVADIFFHAVVIDIVHADAAFPAVLPQRQHRGRHGDDIAGISQTPFRLRHAFQGHDVLRAHLPAGRIPDIMVKGRQTAPVPVSKQIRKIFPGFFESRGSSGLCFPADIAVNIISGKLLSPVGPRDIPVQGVQGSTVRDHMKHIHKEVHLSFAAENPRSEQRSAKGIIGLDQGPLQGFQLLGGNLCHRGSARIVRPNILEDVSFSIMLKGGTQPRMGRRGQIHGPGQPVRVVHPVHPEEAGQIEHDGIRLLLQIREHKLLGGGHGKPHGPGFPFVFLQVLHLQFRQLLRDGRGSFAPEDHPGAEPFQISVPHHLHGPEGIPADGKEIVMDAHCTCLQAQYPFKGGADLPLRFAAGRRIRGLPDRQFRLRQGLPVRFAVRRFRNGFQARHTGGNHILRQGPGQELRDVLCLQGDVGGVVQTKRLVLHRGGRLNDARVLHGGVFHLSQLDAEAVELDLGVDAADTVQHPVLSAFSQVPGMIHANLPSPVIPLHKGAVAVDLRGLLRKIPVPPADLNPCHADFPGDAGRQKMAKAIHKEAPEVGHRLSDGNFVVLPAAFHRIAGDDIGAFRGSVLIDIQHPVTDHAGQLFPAGGHEAYIRISPAGNQDRQRRGKAGSGDPVIPKERHDRVYILPDLRGHNMQARARRKGRKNQIHRAVEAEAAVNRHPVRRIQLQHPDEAFRQVQEPRMVQHDALGQARGAGGIDHIGVALWGGKIHRRSIPGKIEFLRKKAFLHPDGALRLPVGKKTAGGDQRTNAGVFHHVIEPLRGILRIQRQIGRSRLVNGLDADRKKHTALQQDPNELIRPNPRADQFPGQEIGPPFHLAIGHFLPAVVQGEALRVSGRLPGNQAGHRPGQVHLQQGAGAAADDLLLLFFRQDLQIPQIFLPRHVKEHMIKLRDNLPNCLLGKRAVGVADFGPESVRTFLHFEGEINAVFLNPQIRTGRGLPVQHQLTPVQRTLIREKQIEIPSEAPT